MPMLPNIPPINAVARPVPQHDAARYPGIAKTSAAIVDVIACWKKMPGPVEWRGTLFKEMRLGVCLQMVTDKVHLQKKKGA